MNKEQVTQWLLEWFTKNSGIQDFSLEIYKDNYLEKGWIDSIAFITLISNIEDAFKIRFSNNEFQDRSFATIEGLSQHIFNRIHE